MTHVKRMMVIFRKKGDRMLFVKSRSSCEKIGGNAVMIIIITV